MSAELQKMNPEQPVEAVNRGSRLMRDGWIEQDETDQFRPCLKTLGRAHDALRKIIQLSADHCDTSEGLTFAEINELAADGILGAEPRG